MDFGQRGIIAKGIKQIKKKMQNKTKHLTKTDNFINNHKSQRKMTDNLSLVKRL